MQHWTSKYLTLKYKDYNCSKFVEFVLRDHFGIKYEFPQSKGSLFNQSMQIKESLPVFCRETVTPTEGDLILMSGIRRLCHVGMLVVVNGKKYVFHTESSMKTAALHEFKDLSYFGYFIEGFYTWAK